jgi:hypothetical protein
MRPWLEATPVTVMMLLSGVTLEKVAEAAEPIQVVAVAGQIVCTDFSEPRLVGPDVKVNGIGFFDLNVADSVVRVEVHTSQTRADFEVLEGPGVDAFVAKGAKDAQLYTFADAPDAQELATAASQKIQGVTVCSDGEDTVLPNLPFSSCNVGDNRDLPEDDQCTATDKQQGTIAIKVATKNAGGAEKGQTFGCLCGDIELVDVEGTVPGALDEFEAFAITQVNPTCLVWTKVGGTKKCVLEK